MRCKQSEKDALFRALVPRPALYNVVYVRVQAIHVTSRRNTGLLYIYIARSSVGRNVVELNDLVQEFYHYHRAIRSSSATFSTMTRYA